MAENRTDLAENLEKFGSAEPIEPAFCNSAPHLPPQALTHAVPPALPSAGQTLSTSLQQTEPSLPPSPTCIVVALHISPHVPNNTHEVGPHLQYFGGGVGHAMCWVWWQCFQSDGIKVCSVLWSADSDRGGSLYMILDSLLYLDEGLRAWHVTLIYLNLINVIFIMFTSKLVNHLTQVPL